MKSIIWKGIKYDSKEYLKIFIENEFHQIESSIIGVFEDKKYFVQYKVTANSDWTVKYFEIKSEINDEVKLLSGQNNSGKWLINNHANNEFDGFCFIDISLTPFTNTFPINSLNFDDKKDHNIKVIYIDVLNNEIKPVAQNYSKVSVQKFLYKNSDNTFQAELEINEEGLVLSYPNLFISQTN